MLIEDANDFGIDMFLPSSKQPTPGKSGALEGYERYGAYGQTRGGQC